MSLAKSVLVIVLALISPSLLAGEDSDRIAIAIAIAEANRPQPKPVSNPPKSVSSTKLNVVTAKAGKASGLGAIAYVHNHPNCAACVRFERNVLTDPEVIKRLNRFNFVIMSSKEAVNSKAESYPWLDLVAPDWKIRGGIPAPATAAEMVQLLDTITGETK